MNVVSVPWWATAEPLLRREAVLYSTMSTLTAKMTMKLLMLTKMHKENIASFCAFTASEAEYANMWAIMYGTPLHYPTASIPQAQRYTYFEDLCRVPAEEVRKRLREAGVQGEIPKPHLAYMKMSSITPYMLSMYQRCIRHFNTGLYMYPLRFPPNDDGRFPALGSELSGRWVQDEHLPELCQHYGLPIRSKEEMTCDLALIFMVAIRDTFQKEGWWALAIASVLLLKTPEHLYHTIPKKYDLAIETITARYRAWGWRGWESHDRDVEALEAEQAELRPVKRVKRLKPVKKPVGQLVPVEPVDRLEVLAIIDGSIVLPAVLQFFR